MGYRRNKKVTYAWTRWLDENFGFLTLECGVPAEALRDRKNWYCLLDHGFYTTKDNAPQFEVDSLSGAQCRKLYDFILAEEENPKQLQTFRILKDLINE